MLAGRLLRTFVCVKLPPRSIAKISSWIDAQKRMIPHCGIRWVRPETIHITLKFCGEMQSEPADAILSSLDKKLPRGAFELSAGPAE